MATRKPYIAQPAQTVDYDALMANLNGLPGATPEQAPSRGLLRGAADLGLEAASGATKGIKFMSDVFGADNPVSQGLQGVSDFAKELQSAQARGEDQRIAQLMKEAEDKGIGEQVKAALRAAGEAPVRQAIGAIGTSVPMIAASMVPGLREASWGARAAALGGMGGAQGVGVVKSSMYDAVYQRAIEEGRSEQEARALAQQAQAYSPENAGDIALGGALGVGAALTGFEPAAARAVGGAAAKAAASKTAQRGLMQSTLRGTLAEAIPEATQGFQEQVAGNRAEQRAGFDTPTFRGAAGSATLEGLLSAPGGAVGGMLDARGAKPASKLLADQIRATELVPETGPMTRAANQAVEAKAQQVEMTAGAESAALAAIEQQAQDDLQGLRDFAGRSPDVVAGMPVAGAQPAAPGADLSAEFIDSPFLDRIQTVQEMLADPATREKVRARWGDEGLNNIAYYAGMANRTGLPEKTQNNLLGMAERLLSESVLAPIQPTPELDGMRRDPLTLGNQPQPATPALGMDGTPSGRFTVDPQGNVSPESRAQRGDAQRRADEIDSLGRQTPRGQAQPEATMQGALGIGMDTAPTGRLLAGQDGVRPETRMDAINIGQADMQRQAEVAQRAEMGLTPDIEAVQQRNAMRSQDGDILNPSGKPFKTLMAAQRAAKKNPGQVVEVTGGFAIRPATMVAAQPEVANDRRGNQDAAGLAEALAVGNSEAGDRAATEPAAVAQGEMLDAIPGQPAGDQPAQGDAGQGQRVGREGYDTPIELDAAQLKTILEKTRKAPLVDKPAKLEAWRNGTAKTDPNKYPVELAFTTDGRLDVNDGRHRIALAAERGEKVTAFIDGKDAQRAQELLANVQNLPQPAAAQAPANQAPEAARGDGATPAGVPDQGGAAAAVEAVGVEQQPATNAEPANEALPETGGVITADDVAGAEKQAAQMISDRIDGMKATDVQRIAARYLPTVGVKAPMGKARIKAAMTDAAAMNLLGPAGELGIELSDSVKRALTAKMEGRVGEAAAPVAAKPEQQKPQAEQQRTEYPFGRVANGEEDRFFQSRVRVLPDMKGDTAWGGEVGSVLNGGRLIEVKRDGQDFRVRIPGDRIEVLDMKDSKSTETRAVTPIDRFEELRANGTDPDSLQNGLAALRKVAGRAGESTADFASRYIGEMGSQRIGTASGEEVLEWMESTLIRKAWDDQSIPGANAKSISKQATAAYWRDQLDRYERDSKSFNDYLAKMDQRTFDVESMGGSAERIAQAREAIQEMNRKADQNKRELDAGLKAAEAREQAEKDQEEAETNAKFKPADLKDLEKKPTPASISGWSNAVYQGGPAWTNGHLVDLVSEPHLSGWQDRMNALRKDAPPLDAGRVVPKSQGTPLKLVGIYDNGNSTAPISTVYLESNGRLTALNRNYYRYFASKYKGAEFQSHGETQPVTVHLDGRMVGLVMPINLGRDGIKLDEVKAKIAANLKREQESAKDAAAAEFDVQTQQPAIAPEAAPTEDASALPYTSQQIASAYAQAESAIRGKTWSSNADSTHKGRIRLRLKDMGMGEQDAQALLDRAATIQAGEMAGMKGAMMFLRLKDLQRAAIDRGLVAEPSADPAPQPATQEQPAEAPADVPKLTQAEAAQLMEWQDMGQKNGVKTHALRFYASQADKDAKRGIMTLITVSKGDVSDKAWTVDGDDQKFGMLAQAKKRGMELGMARAVKDGFVVAAEGRAVVSTANDKLIGKDINGNDVFMGTDGPLKGVPYYFDERGQVRTGAALADQTPKPAATKATEEKPAGKPVTDTAEKAPPAMPIVAGIPVEAARRAFDGTSFTPERRGQSLSSEFDAELSNAWNQAMRVANGREDAISRVTEVFKDVAGGYRARVMDYLGAHSRVMSSMISGPARFPVERNRKRSEIADRKGREANEYLQRGIKRMLKAARGPIDNSPESELESVRYRLAQREELQEKMKAANAAIRAKDDEALADLGFSEAEIADLKKPDFAGRVGYAPYELTNNNAEIRRLRERLTSAESRLAAAQAGPTESDRDGVRVVEDAQDDRLRLIFDGKPSEAVRDDLKANGFKWSPKNEAWQRQLTDNARAAARRVLDKHFPRADDGSKATMFSRADRKSPGQTVAETTSIASAIAKRWANAPEIVVAADMNDAAIPQAVRDYDAKQRSLGAQGDPEGFWYDGKVYLVAKSMASPSDVMRVLFHESLGHYGLRGVFGDALDPILNQIAALRRADVQAKADEYGLDLSKPDERLQAAEEVLSVMAQTKPELGYVKRAIAAIRSWMRRTFPKLFGQMKLTDAEIIRDFILPARGWVEGGPGGGPKGGLPAMSRGTSDGMEQEKPLTEKQFYRTYYQHRMLRGPADAEAIMRDGWQEGGIGPNVLPAYRGGQPSTILERRYMLRAGDTALLIPKEGVRDTPNGPKVRAGWKPRPYEVVQITSDGPAMYQEYLQALKAWQDSMTGNTNPNIRFSRTAAAKAYVAPAMDKLNETFSHPGKLSWWHKTVGSMYNLAERMPAFKPVYDAAQNFINDVSFYAIEAADKAPRLLPRLEDWKDLAKSPITAQDNKAVAAPVFEGTLSWRRDESGKPVLVEDLAKRYASLTPEQKAQRLLRANAISENVLKMWQGMPKDQYASSVNTAFEGRMLKAGIVFTPDELKSIFKLNDAQVALYQEFRQSIDASLDNMGKSDLLRVAGKDAADLKDAVMSAPDVDAAAVLLRDHLLELAKENPDRSDALVTTANDMIARAEKVQRLKMEGYAPLSRFGQYTVDVVVDGERQYFSMFETARDANRMAAKLKMEYGAENVAQGTLSQREFEMLQGITPESLELFGNMLGLDSTGNEAQDQVFQEYLKRTKANRSAMKRLIHRKGIAGYSEDVGRVLAAFVYSNARQTSAALHMGDLGEAVMAIPKGEGELKDAAVELARYVKEPREEAAKVRGWLFAQYLGGSIASAIVNFTQPLTTSAPYLSQFGGMGKSVKALYQAMADLKDKKFEAGLAESFKKRTEDGTLAPQGVHELMAQSRGEATLRTGDGTQMGDALAKGQNTLAKVMIGWGKLFGMAEQINRQSTYVAAYRMAVERGMADPDAFAKKAVDETQFVNNKANKMKFGRGAIGATLMTFKSYSLNWLELFHRLATQNGREGKMAAAWMLGVLLLSAGASGLPFAEDAEDLVDFLAQRLGYNWSSKKARQEFLEDLFGRDIAGFVENGVTGLPGAPIDVSGRLGMGNMIPGTGLFLSKKDHTSDFTEVLGPAGDLAKRTFQAGDLLLSGNVGQAALMIAPKAIGNLEKGVDMAANGMYRDARGYKVDDATTGEAIGKAIGFQPRAVAQIQEASGLNQRAKDFYRLKVERINAKWAKAIFEKDAATVDEVRAEIKEWNRQNPDQRIQANIPAILRRVKEMRKTKAERIADTAPKALRASMQEEARRMREEQ